jgi:hypothetical protein
LWFGEAIYLENKRLSTVVESLFWRERRGWHITIEMPMAMSYLVFVGKALSAKAASCTSRKA